MGDRNCKILVYSGEKTSTGSLLPALKDSFAGAAIDIETATSSTLKQKLEEKYLAFVLPGIIGADSPYPSQLTPDIVKEIHRKIENGMVGIFICAGAAFFSRETKYDPPWGRSKRNAQLHPLFNGVAKGPIPQLARKPDGHDVGDISPARVSYTDKDQNEKETALYYGNGTYFLPDNDDDPDMKVIARFVDVEGNPPAIIKIAKGKGFAYFMAVHPEIGPMELSKDASVKNINELRQLMSTLAPFEPDRKELWGMIMDDIITHKNSFAPA